MLNLGKIGRTLSKGVRTDFARSAFFPYFGISPSLKPDISTQWKKVWGIWSTFMYEGLESNPTKVGRIRTDFDQGGNRFCQVGIFGNVSICAFLHLLPGGVRGSFEITLVENPYSLVCKGENRLPLSFLVLDKIKMAFFLSFPPQYIVSYGLAASS